jgi:hypothetical protein
MNNELYIFLKFIKSLNMSKKLNISFFFHLIQGVLFNSFIKKSSDLSIICACEKVNNFKRKEL